MGRPAVAGRLPAAGRGAGPGAGPQALQPPLAAGAPRPRLDAAQRRPADRAGAPAGRAPLGGGRRRRDRPAAHASCARTRATAAPSGRSTPAGPSGTHRLQRDTDGAAATGWRAGPTRIARTFDRICALLTELRLPAAGRTRSPTAGRQLARIWTESDLLVAECLRARRVGGAGRRPSWPRRCRRWCSRPAGTTTSRAAAAAAARSATRSAETVRLWAELEADEARAPAGADPRAGPRLRLAAYRWARGRAAGPGAGQRRRPAGAAGRRLRPLVQQVIDLLGQLAAVGRSRARGWRATAREAVGAVRRGVVAYSGTV